MSQALPPQYKENYAQRVARVILEDWKDRPARKPSGDLWVILLELDTYLSEPAEIELRQLLNAEGIDFEFNQVYEGGRIKKQRKYLHLYRDEDL